MKNVLLAFLCCLPLFIGVASAAPGETGHAPPAAAGQPAPATLEVGGRDIVTFRAMPSGRLPSDRVESAKRHLRAAYERNKRPVPSLRTVEAGAQVLVDGKVMFVVVDGDVDRQGGETPAEVAGQALDQLRLVLDEIDERGDVRAVLSGAGLALAATLFWVLLLRWIFLLNRRVGRWAERVLAEKVHKVRISGVSILHEHYFARGARLVVHLGAWAVGLAVSFAWLDAALTAVPHSRPWGQRLASVLLDVLSTVGQGMLDALPGLIFVVVIFIIARVIARSGGMFFERVRNEELSFGWLDRDTAPPTRMVFTATVWLFALAMAYPYLPGAKSQAFQGLSVLLGLMVSIGASGTVGQATSGLILMYTRAFRIGEFVRIQDTEGTVIEMGLFSTRVRTGMGEEVMLPNTLVLANTSRNYSRVVPGAGFVLDTVVTIGYDAPWRQVQAMLVEAATRVPAIAAEPEPRVIQTALSDFYVEYRLVAYSRAEAPLPRAEAMNQLHGAIQDVFNEYGVQIMSPHYLGDPAEAKVVPKARWFEKPAASSSSNPAA